jgi:hypothetical protein
VQAAAVVESVVAQLDDFDIFYDALDNRGGGGGGGAGGKRPPAAGGAARAAAGGCGGGAVFFKRRRAAREARWSDFARYLALHPEQRRASAEGLREVYEAWRAGFGYVAEFGTMLRALRRHGQLLGGGPDAAGGSEPLRYAEPLGQGLDPSSSEEEDVDSLLEEREARNGRLGRALARQADALARAEAHHARELGRRVAGLERHHAGLAEAAARRHAAEAAASAAVVCGLEARVRELEARAQPPAEPVALGCCAGCCGGKGAEALSQAEQRVAELGAANAMLVREIAAQQATIDSLHRVKAQRDVAIEAIKQRLKQQVQVRACNRNM